MEDGTGGVSLRVDDEGEVARTAVEVVEICAISSGPFEAGSTSSLEGDLDKAGS